jgi:hypothetical protein
VIVAKAAASKLSSVCVSMETSALALPPNHCMQPTPQTVTKFAYANLPPVWRAADAGC